MTDVYSLIGIITLVLGLVIGAAGRLSKAQQDRIVDALTKDNVATKDYNKTLEGQIAAVTAERDSLKVQAADLKDLAQGSPELRRLTAAISNQTKILTEFITRQGGVK